MAEALGYIGRGIKEHTITAAETAKKDVETPLFDVSRLNLSENERAIYNCLDSEPLHVDEIIGRTELAAGAINAGLISLRLKGLIKQLPGNMFLRN